MATVTTITTVMETETVITTASGNGRKLATARRNSKKELKVRESANDEEVDASAAEVLVHSKIKLAPPLDFHLKLGIRKHPRPLSCSGLSGP